MTRPATAPSRVALVGAPSAAPLAAPLGVLVAALVAAASLTPSAAWSQTAEDAATACGEAARLIGEEDLEGALDEAKWCVESLEQLRRQRMLSVFPEAIDGFTGGELDNQSAMGMTIMNRIYAGEEGAVDVSLTTGAAGAGLAALAQMGMSLGGSAAGKKIRVQRRTVVDMSEAGGEARYMVELKSGGMLTISSSSVPADAVLAFVEAFPIAELDDALMP